MVYNETAPKQRKKTQTRFVHEQPTIYLVGFRYITMSYNCKKEETNNSFKIKRKCHLILEP